MSRKHGYKAEAGDLGTLEGPPIAQDRDGVKHGAEQPGACDRLKESLWLHHPWGDERFFDREIPFTRRIA